MTHVQPVSDSAKKESRRLKPVSGDVAKVFGDDDESEEEEMPIEARIRMRNKGRETPTSSGPNSFGKGRFGFVDRRALLDRQLEALNEQVSGDNEDGLLVMIAILLPNVASLCGFGKVKYAEAYLRFPQTKIMLPDNAEVGTKWSTPDGLFDCAVFGVGFPSLDSFEVSCCHTNSSDIAPWEKGKKLRLLRGFLQIYMEASLG
ncbi:unnamed protein product [Mesocestoides corti]|uniref:PEST proteolytic signal-containing nuclear protein n=2 Tax=Mesocestoides corti TaxID=53468 RepID=A0A0R3UKY2_MESCO|nr:unnamed protein product [Mesocestoides corti]